MTGTINDLMDENARLKTKVEELEARWKKLRETIHKERDTFEKKPGNAAGIWESGYGQGLTNALMFLKDLE